MHDPTRPSSRLCLRNGFEAEREGLTIELAGETGDPIVSAIRLVRAP